MFSGSSRLAPSMSMTWARTSLSVPSRRGLATELERLAFVVDAGGSWVAPAVPVVAIELRRLLAGQVGVVIQPRAERLLSCVEKLPATASAVAHLCEHRPGRPGVVIATTGDPLVDATLSGLPDRRHDAVLGRWWIPAGSCGRVPTRLR